MSKKWLMTSAAMALAANFFLTGCGGSGSTSTGPELTDEVFDAEPGAAERLAKSLETGGMPDFKKTALKRLGAMGAKASSVIPKIEKCAAEDGDEDVRKLATETLAKIKG